MEPQVYFYAFFGLITGVLHQAHMAKEEPNKHFSLVDRTLITLVAGFFWPIIALMALGKDLQGSR